MDEKLNEEFMQLAIAEAKKSSESLPCGAVIVKNGKAIAKAHNSARATYNASAHAEINAIRQAGKIIGSKKLEGCAIYCTCEPCVMCLSAIAFARIDKVVYGLNLRDVSPREKIIDITLEEFLAKSPHKFAVEKNYMEKKCKEVVEK